METDKMYQVTLWDSNTENPEDARTLFVDTYDKCCAGIQNIKREKEAQGYKVKQTSGSGLVYEDNARHTIFINVKPV